ncbi:hypothetical protein NK553_14620 [Pseudomonas sp. ZM23]|uniref:Uncharacterized protein n=1 Tax=Pseudomonas triclosanedens TaxID=2961893 RepID=A0ABY6ZXL2_9PSED|nr:hypothetical protein [Pseudomonas triclosanedens]MCP8465183.1 hypothetical protein [Pseudomonas triclosanedens]MCP8470877.1 hypothetical protein [Pseudomonas triclosanedens]MCP8476554.1 hypothetical protein [Pseudomonas triclosanedens]WAI49061.1 hypothetical protein OU419_25480 [Pseudomonas triclosanedens]
MRVTVTHLHSVPTWTARQGYCHRATRAFFERHNLDWLEFVRNGIDEEALTATGDALALRLVEHAREVGDGQ